MKETITTKTFLGSTINVTFDDNPLTIFLENVESNPNVTIDKKNSLLPKTDMFYKVADQFKDALYVMATSDNSKDHFLVYSRKNKRCRNWSVTFCKWNNK